MLISDAYAQTASTASTDPLGGITGFLPIILMVGVVWFMVFRPQMKRTKEHKQLLDALAKGDEVITQGGIAGKVVQVQDSFVKLSIADNVEIMVQKPAIVTVLPKGTLKNS